MVFGIIPECRSASFRNRRSASPESPCAALCRRKRPGDVGRRGLWKRHPPQTWREQTRATLADGFTCFPSVSRFVRLGLHFFTTGRKSVNDGVEDGRQIARLQTRKGRRGEFTHSGGRLVVSSAELADRRQVRGATTGCRLTNCTNGIATLCASWYKVRKAVNSLKIKWQRSKFLLPKPPTY